MSYMDDVPVKISERCKPPPPISVPSGLFERASSLAERVERREPYDFALETNVLRKLDEWRGAREAARNERDHRLRLKEDERQRRLERLAEEERRREQLSVSRVSYPSAEELSAEAETATEEPRVVSPTILQPTPVRPSPRPSDLLDDPDPIAELRRSVRIESSKIDRGDVDKLTFSDFENDTSSPFDNMELKTINELELLAQVLNLQSSSNGDGVAPNALPPSAYRHYDKSASYYAPNFNYLAAYGTTPENDLNSYSESNRLNFPIAGDNKSFDRRVDGYEFGDGDYAAAYDDNPISSFRTSALERSYVPRERAFDESRSRSVPDIVKELDEELAEARLKQCERSHNGSPAPRREERIGKLEQRLPDPLEGVSPRLRSTCERIHGMGFPLDRVARACEAVGEDDKKIVEYLLSMGQLMDLGFSETQVAKALLQHNHNRDKALDELIS